MSPGVWVAVGNRPHHPPIPRDLKSKAPPGEQRGPYFSNATAESGWPHPQPSKIAVAFSIYQPRPDTLQDCFDLPGPPNMTTPRLAAIAIACLVFIDVQFGGGQIVDAFWDQAKSVGHSLSNEIQGLTYRLARH
jgi:hypothetical protein